MGFVLFIVAMLILGIAIVVNSIFVPIYYIVTLKWKSGVKALDKWFYQLALSIDQLGNVMCASLFNVIFIDKDGHKYGDEDDTISYVTARNKYKGKLKSMGYLLYVILELLDKGHSEKAIYNKIKRDEEAVKRNEENKYFD